MRRVRAGVLASAVAASAFLWCAAVAAHGDVDERIESLDRTLDGAADETAEAPWLSHLRRGELHRREGAWQAALADFDRALALRPGEPAAMLGRAQTHLDRGEHDAALRGSARILARHPDHARAALVRARAQAALGRTDAAARAYALALASLDAPTPNHYLEYAGIVRAGKTPGAGRRAVAVLDEGARALGHPVTLHRAALGIERDAGRHAAALERVDALLAREPALHALRRERGELLLALGRPEEARTALRDLTERLHGLPPRRLGTPAMRELLSRVERDLGRLERDAR